MRPGLERLLIRVEGIVQGVGFRPHVYALARRLALTGWVGNDAQGVFIEVEGTAVDLARFQDELRRYAPPLAVIHRMTATRVPARADREFRIAESRRGGEPTEPATTLISPDVATCGDCLAELFDPGDRRYRYPFVNCTACGPRFTIIRAVPYDRPATTMAGFALCAECAAEYRDPRNRRFHAQPTCCPACGPTLRLLGPGITDRHDDPITAAAELLRAGGIVAVKGLGGYHLAVDAGDEDAVRRLRSRKHREGRPFAVLVPDLGTARALCVVDPAAERLLTGACRPIVLVPRRRRPPRPVAADAASAGDMVAASVAPGNRELGLILPYTPLHHLLARELGRPYVLTSGNVSDEPIAHRDEEAVERLAGIADGFLTHDRPIHVRADDSVVRVVRGRELPVRRSRGYAPRPLRLTRPATRAVLGCGAESKSTFCLATADQAFVSHHVGDLENHETLRSFIDGIAHFQRIFDITPRVVAHDLHPEYLSTKYAMDLDDVELVGVQHHHAHIASCLADNQEDGTVIGVAFDGTGYGPDGTIWGGELLVADLTGFVRVGRLAPVPLPGGATAIRRPWRMAVAHLDVAYAGSPPSDLAVRARHRSDWDDVRAVARSGVNSPPTSSAGRLFDAVAAILGVRDSVDYEGQAAIELEQLADVTETSGYAAGIGTALAPDGSGAERAGGPVDGLVLQTGDLIRAVVDDMRRGTGVATIAARFQHGLADVTLSTCLRVSDATGIDTVALSGGVFQNGLLLDRLAGGLERHGLRVLTHHRVPPNDGGISLGQVAVAAARNAPGGHE